ncbi:MAG: site-specific integrase [Nocardioidaceae bacterium]|nr:site-specific integrase [Nocardioidaceae bacterium]MCL2611851.1 site-specific integrase [Nocardioidaceae bacterium]
MNDGVIPRSPHVGVKLGRHSDHERAEARFLTLEEFARLLAATPERWRPLVMFLAGTGARWGEVVALNVADVNLDAATVSITKAEKVDPTAPGRVRIGPTKTRKSRRTIGLPSELVTILKELTQGRGKNERLFVMLDEDGEPMRRWAFYRNVWLAKSCAGAGLLDPHPRIHDLRHSHAAWLIAEGVPLPVIQARLGHEKITTTVDTYGHLVPDLQQAAADATARVFAAMPKTAALQAAEPKAIA